VSESLLSVGEKLHIISRRLFPEDIRPHFAAEVRAAMGPLIRADGYLFIFDSGTNSYMKHPEVRTRLFSISDSGYIVTVLPEKIDLGRLTYRTTSGRLAITDGQDFLLEINEFGLSN